MIERLRLFWLELRAAYHLQMVHDHQLARVRVLDRLRKLQRDRAKRETEREIRQILARKGLDAPPRPNPSAPPRLVHSAAGPRYVDVTPRFLHLVRDDVQ